MRSFLINGFFELPRLFEQIDMSLEFGPTGKPTRAGKLQLGGGEGLGAAGINQVSSLVFQMAKIGMSRRTRTAPGSWLVTANSFHANARCSHCGPKEVSRKLRCAQGGLLPFPRTGCVLQAISAYYNLK